MRLNNLQIFRELLFDILGSKCIRCNSTENLHIHHLDKDHTNNEIKNVEVLCRECHYKCHSMSLDNLYDRKKNKLLITKCSKCKKVLYSLYKKQLDYNFKAHKLGCKGNKKGEDKP